MDMILLSHLAVFLVATVVDALWIAWIHYSQKGAALMSGLCSMLLALPTLMGTLAAVHDPHYAPAYVLGLGVGSAVAVWWKGRKARRAAAGASARSLRVVR